MSFTLDYQQELPGDLHSVFSFFADPINLEAITPPWLRFRVLGSSTERVEEGTTIDYKLRLRGLPIRWQSVISRWEPPYRFVDSQVVGPYRSWVHLHTFEEIDGGVLVKDHVDYEVPGGAIVNRLFVRRDLEKIFSFRQERIAALLGREEQFVDVAPRLKEAVG